MNVGRLSVTLPSDLCEELRKVAVIRGNSISALVTEAIARELRLIALEDAIRHAELESSPVPENEIILAIQALVPKPTKRTPA
jgi:metal-responsive CopG/Arc/MetJ family transcriptional regulator